MDRVKLEAVRTGKPFRWADLVVFGALVLLTALSVWGVYRGKGATVVITAPGFSASYPLERDRVIELDKMKVVIENGAVYVTEADCPDRVCEHTGRIRYENQSIVCLPNKVTITIAGGGAINGSTGQS